MRIKNVLILADDSEPSRAAVRVGYDLAADFNATVVLMSVLDKSLAMGDVDAGIFPEEALKKLEAQIKEMLISLKKEFGHGTKTKILIPIGDINNSVAPAIEKAKAHMVVVGTHGRKGLRHLIEGSVAGRILRISSVPVLVVPLKRR